MMDPTSKGEHEKLARLKREVEIFGYNNAKSKSISIGY